MKSSFSMVTLCVLFAVQGCVNVEITLPWLEDRLPVVEIDGVGFEVEVADDEWSRMKGLSERPHLSPATGMLFIPDRGYLGAFWMKGMRFPLDFVWIGRDCEVVDFAVNVPIPPESATDEDLRQYRSIKPAAYALEVNAGDVERFNIEVGNDVEFVNVGDDGCGY